MLQQSCPVHNPMTLHRTTSTATQPLSFLDAASPDPYLTSWSPVQWYTWEVLAANALAYRTAQQQKRPCGSMHEVGAQGNHCPDSLNDSDASAWGHAHRVSVQDCCRFRVHCWLQHVKHSSVMVVHVGSVSSMFSPKWLDNLDRQAFRQICFVLARQCSCCTSVITEPCEVGPSTLQIPSPCCRSCLCLVMPLRAQVQSISKQ
jgi:hypothetical protein